MKVELATHDLVDRDITEIWKFIARKNEDAADSVFAAIHAGIEKIAETPQIGPRYPTPFLHLAKLRMLPITDFPNYLIFYLEDVADGHLKILYVTHGARDFAALFDEDFRR